jgi:Peptidase family S41
MKTVLFAFMLLITNVIMAQQKLTLTINASFIGEDLKAYANYTIKEGNFELYSRTLPGIKKPLIRTDSCFLMNDSILGKIIIANKLMAFKGYLKNGGLNAIIISLRTGEILGNLTGNATEIISTNYSTLMDSMFINTERYIFNTDYLKEKSYLNFKKELNNVKGFIKDDVELIALINSKTEGLPFTHFSFTKMRKRTLDSYTNAAYETNTKGATVNYIEEQTALLTIPNFNGNGKLLSTLMKAIIKKKIANLIIDLRGNTGGGAGAAMQLMQHLSTEKKLAGALVTNKWFAQNNRIPVAEDYKNFAVFNGGSTTDIINGMKIYTGIVLQTEPSKKQYLGNVYILTDSSTASTCEPLVYGLQYFKKATIVGTTTAGAMLSKAPIDLQNNYVLFIPLADYYTIDGKRIDKVGVAPNINTSAANALTTVLEKIKKEAK